MTIYLRANHPVGNTEAKPFTYSQVYRNLDGLTALAVAQSTSLRKLKDEKDTAFVKRIVATYVMISGAV